MKTPARRALVLLGSDRAELCRRVDLCALMVEDGLEIRPSGDHFVARDERTPNCHVWPPGVGRQGDKGWTYFDFGDDAGGDALAYVIESRGLDFADAVRFMAENAGFWPSGWKKRGNGHRKPPGAPEAHHAHPYL